LGNRFLLNACAKAIALLALIIVFPSLVQGAEGGEKSVFHRRHADDEAGVPAWRITVQAGGRHSGTAETIKKRAETMMEDVVEYLGHEPDWTYNIYLTSSDEDFARAAGPGAPGWAVAIYTRKKIVVRPEGFSSDPENFYNTIQHELVHGVLDHMFRGRPRALPRWLNEGIAVTVSGSWEIPQSWERRKTTLYAALEDGSAFDFDQISRSFPSSQWLAQIAYAQSTDFVQYLVRREGKETLRDLLVSLAAGGDFDRAVSSLYGKRFEELVEDWEKDIRRPGAIIWVVHILANINLYIWLGIVVLVIVGYFVVRKRPSRVYPDDEYDPYEDWDELDEEWDIDTYGHRPWRPGSCMKFYIIRQKYPGCGCRCIQESITFLMASSISGVEQGLGRKCFTPSFLSSPALVLSV